MASSEQTQEGGEIDPEMAAQLARDRLADRLRPPAASESSDVAQLVEYTSRVTRAVEDGEVPERTDLGTARFYLDEIKKRLDEAALLYGWNRWDTGVCWGELSEEERAEVEARDVSIGGESEEGDGAVGEGVGD